MRLLRVRVPGYGPLRGTELEFGPGLNVVYGPNEAGKTTLVDYLLANLFRWERRTGTRLETVMTGLDRFGDASAADGSVELEMGGEVHRYPEGPSLLHALELEHAGLAGLFCVRSGELELPEKEGGEFWRELKKVLSGLPKGVETLREKAHLEAGLTRTGERSDRGDPGPKTRHARLTERIEVLEELEARLEEAGEYEERIASLERRAERLERSRRARIAELREELAEVEADLGELPPVPGGRLEAWREAERERERLAGEVEEQRGAVERARSKQDDREALREEARRAVEALRERKRAAEEAELEDRARRLAAGPSPAGRRAADLAYWAGTAVAVIAMGFAFFTPSDALRGIVLPVLGALAVGAGLAYWGRTRRERREERAGEERELLEQAASCALEVEEPADVPRAIRSLEADLGEAERELADARARAEGAAERVEEEEQELERLRREREERAGEASALSDELDFESLEEASRAAERREELEEERDRLRATLEGIAGGGEEPHEPGPDPDGEEELPEWDADERARVDRELERTRRDYQALRDDFVAAGLGAPEDVLTELRECRREVREIELDWEAGELAGEIFRGMDRALENRLSGALEREGELSVAGLVERITGRYRRVSRAEDGTLRLETEDGRSFAISRLSRGARDQVYLALRLGLAETALDAAGSEEAGFFLLDDAFLTADWGRRERLVGACRDLADAGWQLVYLTCDDHLRGLFEDAGAESFELSPP